MPPTNKPTEKNGLNDLAKSPIIYLIVAILGGTGLSTGIQWQFPGARGQSFTRSDYDDRTRDLRADMDRRINDALNAQRSDMERVWEAKLDEYKERQSAEMFQISEEKGDSVTANVKVYMLENFIKTDEKEETIKLGKRIYKRLDKLDEKIDETKNKVIDCCSASNNHRSEAQSRIKIYGDPIPAMVLKNETHRINPQLRIGK